MTSYDIRNLYLWLIDLNHGYKNLLSLKLYTDKSVRNAIKLLIDGGTPLTKIVEFINKIPDDKFSAYGIKKVHFTYDSINEFYNARSRLPSNWDQFRVGINLLLKHNNKLHFLCDTDQQIEFSAASEFSEMASLFFNSSNDHWKEMIVGSYMLFRKFFNDESLIMVSKIRIYFQNDNLLFEMESNWPSKDNRVVKDLASGIVALAHDTFLLIGKIDNTGWPIIISVKNLIQDNENKHFVEGITGVFVCPDARASSLYSGVLYRVNYPTINTFGSNDNIGVFPDTELESRFGKYLSLWIIDNL